MFKAAKWFTGFTLVVLMAPGMLRADELAQTGRQFVPKYQDAVVTVQLVVKTTMTMDNEEGHKKEDKVETTGAVIDPSGLVVASLAAISPGEAVSRMFARDMPGMKVSSDITDMKLMLPNGQTMPAAVVLRDKDLDLAFIRPKQKPSAPMAAIDLSKAAKPEMLDETVILYRLGTIGSRSIAACTDRVQSVIEKPRRLYSLGLPAMGAPLGAPVFTMDSNVVGILLLRLQPTANMDMSMSGAIGSSGMMYVVLPAEDVAEAAKQAPQTVPASAAKPTPAVQKTAPAKKPASAK